jgi:hypothetical protein
MYTISGCTSQRTVLYCNSQAITLSKVMGVYEEESNTNSKRNGLGKMQSL